MDNPAKCPQKRYLRMKQLENEGHPLQFIADSFNISRQRAHKILKNPMPLAAEAICVGPFEGESCPHKAVLVRSQWKKGVKQRRCSHCAEKRHKYQMRKHHLNKL